ISNFVLWRESGYFDKAAAAKPLLHLWSLGIEEQFYLLWPPLLVWAWKRKADVFAMAVAIVSISFVTNVILVSLLQSSDMYYLPPIRFWELLIGGALGYASLFRMDEFQASARRALSIVPGLKRFSIENVEAVAGLILIL